MQTRRRFARVGWSVVFASTLRSAGPRPEEVRGTVRAYQGVVTPEMFGAQGDGVANDLAAWRGALAAAEAGGGVLSCRPDARYNWGPVRTPTPLIEITAANLSIQGNGAQIRVHTDFDGIGAPLTLNRPQHVHIADLRFTDTGFDPTAVWKGSHFLMVNAPALGVAGDLRIESCEAVSALGFLTLGSGVEDGRLAGIRLEGRNRAVRCFYGLSCQAQGDDVVGSLQCIDVRRAYIAYGCSNHRLELAIASTGRQLGSNGCIEIASITYDNLKRTETSDIQIRARVSGRLRPYGAVVLFQLQSDTRAARLNGIDVQLDLQDAQVPASTHSFAFRSFDLQSREPAVAAGLWDRISVGGDYIRHGQPFASSRSRPLMKGRLRVQGRALDEQQVQLLRHNFQVEDLTTSPAG